MNRNESAFTRAHTDSGRNCTKNSFNDHVHSKTGGQFTSRVPECVLCVDKHSSRYFWMLQHAIQTRQRQQIHKVKSSMHRQLLSRPPWERSRHFLRKSHCFFLRRKKKLLVRFFHVFFFLPVRRGNSRYSIEVDFDSHKFSVEMACEIINILPVRWRWWWSCIAHNSRNISQLAERFLICVLSWIEIFVDISFDRLAAGVVVVEIEVFDIPIYSSCFGEVDNSRAQALRMTTENCKQDVSRSCQLRSTYNDSSACHPS